MYAVERPQDTLSIASLGACHMAKCRELCAATRYDKTTGTSCLVDGLLHLGSELLAFLRQSVILFAFLVFVVGCGNVAHYAEHLLLHSKQQRFVLVGMGSYYSDK